VAAFRQGLRETGFVEGQNVTIEYRWADNQTDRLPALAEELVHRRVSAIVGHSTAAMAAKAATTTTPVVFVVGNDPVRTGLVSSLNRPGGNVTGVTFSTIDLATKRVGQLLELIPQVELYGVLVDPSLPEHELEVRDAEKAAKAIGRRILALKSATPAEFYPAFEKMVQAGVGALLVGGSAFFTSQRHRLVVLTARHVIPASFPIREFAVAGGLMSYGPNQSDAYRRAGLYVGRILKGEKPGDLPVDQATKFELVLNLGTAKTLGLTVPNAIQLLADEVIE
jgi:putative ABC transport system substrate-binding protein